MARIFLSCSHEDRDLARRIATVLEAAGFDVWWDRQQILPGESFSERIERELAQADQVLVVWSPHSQTDLWVQEEAEVAQVRGKLVQMLVGNASPPLGFGGQQILDLADWDGRFPAPQAKLLVDALRGQRRESAGVVPPWTATPAPSAASAPPPAAAPMPPANTRSSHPAGIGRAVGAVAAGAAGLVVSAGRAIRDFGRRFATRESGDEAPRSEADFPDDTLVGSSAEADSTLATAPAASGVPDGKQEDVLLGMKVDPEAVMLAVAAPRRAQAGSSFTARFGAYVAAARELAQRHLEALGEEGDRVVLDLAPDRQPHWRPGAPVTVRLGGAHLTVSPAERSFEWNGRENVVTFAVTVDHDAPATQVQLCFQVFLGEVEISLITLGLELGATASEGPANGTIAAAPSSAFASYASKDASQVTQRLSTLAHWAPTLDIFQDCLDLVPNEEFKPQLARQIAARDVFLLFWSRHAMTSPWVRWELETARAKPGIEAILPMPLEDPAIAPPPPGFEAKHLRDRYLIAGYGLARIAEVAAASSPAAS